MECQGIVFSGAIAAGGKKRHREDNLHAKQTNRQGTGLGLSLSYDIIKAHGGEIKVETKDGEGSEFIIQLAASSA